MCIISIVDFKYLPLIVFVETQYSVALSVWWLAEANNCFIKVGLQFQFGICERFLRGPILIGTKQHFTGQQWSLLFVP